MDILQTIANRYSCRKYLPDQVPEEILQKILEAGRLAPTAKNLQPFKILVIDPTKHQEALRTMYNRPWFYSAPLILGIFGHTGNNWVRTYDQKAHYQVDCAIVMDHMLLTANSLGLGTCWVCAFDPQKARELAGLPAEYEPVAFTPLGYPADQRAPLPKKPLAEILLRI